MKKQIVFFCATTPYIMIYKMAREFKKNGYETILITISSDESWEKNWYSDGFDKMICSDFQIKKPTIKEPFYVIKKIPNLIKAIFNMKKLNPYAIFVIARPNIIASFAMKFFKNFPRIFFSYDITAQKYKDKKEALRGGIKEYEINAEKYCFENADGILHKGAPEELDFMKGETMLGKNINLSPYKINFHPYCSNDFIISVNKDKLSKNNHEFHIVYTGGMYVDSESIKYYIKTIKKLIEQKIHIHIYSKTQHLSKEEDMKNSALLANEFFGNPYFHIEYSVDPRKLINEISKYDFGLDFVDFGKPSNYPFIFPRFNTGNRTASYLEAGIPFFVNTIYEFECRMAKEYGIGLFLDPMHDFGSFSEKLKKINYKKLERNVLKARADYNMKKQFKRLEKFIEDIRKYHKIKSKAKKASKIILVNDFGEMLMQLRDNIPTISSPNSWGLIGGAVENGESPKTALLRELKEEIPNCHVKNISFLGKMYVPELNHENYIFRGEVSDLIKNIEFTEGQKLRYFKFKKIKKLKVEKIFKNFIYDNKERIFANHEGAK